MKQFIGIAGFTIIALLALWGIVGNYNSVQIPQKPDNTDYIEAFMNDFVITAMNDRGVPRYVIEGEYFEKRKNHDEARINKPVLYMKQQQPWKVVAETALLNEANNTVRLENNVVMEQQNAEPSVTIRTHSLTINTRTEQAYTNDAVTIAQGNSELNSIGLRYNNITSEMELKSRVHGYFVPDKPIK